MSALAEAATIRGGWSMADLDRLASVAARRHGGSTDFDDRYDAAWFEIVAELYSADDVPSERELLFAGVRGVQQSIKQRNRAQGRSQRHDYEFGSAPAFATFWNERLVTPSPEDSITDRVGLAQALATLDGEQYEALAAVAVCGSLQAAADALAITHAQLVRRFYSARRQVLEAWFDGQPPTRATSSETCKSMHAKAQHERTGPTGRRYCQECQRLAKKRRRARGAA